MKSFLTWALIVGMAAFVPSAQAGFPSSGRYLTSSALTPCTSTGVLDLSNTCNDIYFWVGLQ